MSREWDGMPLLERELRRRLMWSLYVSDRELSFITETPYTVIDAHLGIHLPSPMSDTDLLQVPADKLSLPPHDTSTGPTPRTALFVLVHLMRRLTPLLDALCTIGTAQLPRETIMSFDTEISAISGALPSYFKLFPMTNTRYDAIHSYVVPHRVRIHSAIIRFRILLYRAQLALHLDPSSLVDVRDTVASIHSTSLRIQRAAKMLDPKLSPRLFSTRIVFESTVTLGLVLWVESCQKPHFEATPEGTKMKIDVVDGLELLEGAGSVAGAAQASRVVRNLLSRLDAIAGAGTEANHGPMPTTPPLSADQEINQGGTPISPSRGDGAVRVSHWLDRLHREKLSLSHLVTEPVWTAGWERVLMSE